MKKYSDIIFDLDHTLWDFERNSRSALEEIYNEMELEDRGVKNFDRFYANYIMVNDHYWDMYRKGEIEKERLRHIRFEDTLEKYGIMDRSLSRSIGESYLEKSPRKPHLIDGSLEILNYLSDHYELHILTNGFQEVQSIKMESSGLSPFFKHIVASEEAGAKKPHQQAFKYTLDKINSPIDKCIMIGDNIESDIRGARNFGMDAIYFNRDALYPSSEEATHEISHLTDLKSIL